ncbi:hypothetical protein FZEAL_8795 [Fusarium zealandicum]|uniref:Uncharacterized protein n=1 Tax=Fusarium zealandicum TaxID=1053134 RepID=A0A8H4UD79_9HYPO|nr:hypothetical protein FZEAL_8795 [Fusarium zealandicum]
MSSERQPPYHESTHDESWTLTLTTNKDPLTSPVPAFSPTIPELSPSQSTQTTDPQNPPPNQNPGYRTISAQVASADGLVEVDWRKSYQSGSSVASDKENVCPLQDPNSLPKTPDRPSVPESAGPHEFPDAAADISRPGSPSLVVGIMPEDPFIDDEINLKHELAPEPTPAFYYTYESDGPAQRLSPVFRQMQWESATVRYDAAPSQPPEDGRGDIGPCLPSPGSHLFWKNMRRVKRHAMKFRGDRNRPRCECRCGERGCDGEVREGAQRRKGNRRQKKTSHSIGG